METATHFFMRSLLQCQRGATAIEYGLICALIIIVMVVGLSVLGNGSSGMYARIDQEVSATAPPGN